MEPDLAAAYRRCRWLHRRHGRTYYLATRLLPAQRRWHVHALYGFTRYADELVDGAVPPAARASRLRAFADEFRAGLTGAPVSHPVLRAMLHTVATCRLDPADVEMFLHSMAMDLTVAEYADYDALLSYMEGSAAVIGTLLLPILGPTDPVAARGPARQLGLAFQLTNMIRDVAEDLARGRVYLPREDLARFGVTRAGLAAAAARGRADPALRALIRFEAERAWGHYRAAAPGVPLLPPRSQTCVRTAFRLYSQILTEVAAAGYDVFGRRAVVPRSRRLAVLCQSLLTPTGAPVAFPTPAPQPG